MFENVVFSCYSFGSFSLYCLLYCLLAIVLPIGLPIGLPIELPIGLPSGANRSLLGCYWIPKAAPAAGSWAGPAWVLAWFKMLLGLGGRGWGDILS